MPLVPGATGLLTFKVTYWASVLVATGESDLPNRAPWILPFLDAASGPIWTDASVLSQALRMG